jgi:hypothetical protein
MSKKLKPTRAERRARRAAISSEGVYGVDATDAGADGWFSRYLLWASDEREAKARVTAAGFHRKQYGSLWSPGNPPPEVPPGLVPGFPGWWRSRSDDNAWSEWEALPADYRHPPQGLAAIDPSAR